MRLGPHPAATPPAPREVHAQGGSGAISLLTPPARWSWDPSVPLPPAAAPRGPADTRGGWAEARFWIGTVSVIVVALTTWLGLWASAPLVAGWAPVAITSGSMQPTIRPGDVVVAAPHPRAPLEPGDVIVFADARLGGLVTHRIIDVADDGSYTTRGDANRSPDPSPVAPDDVVGVGRLLVPLAGTPAVWAARGQHPLVAGWTVAMLLAGWGCRFALLRRYDPWRPAPVGPQRWSTAAAAGPSPPQGPARRRGLTTAVAVLAALAAVAVPLVLLQLAAGAFSGTAANAGSWAAARPSPPPAAVAETRCEGGTPAVHLAWTPADDAAVDGHRISRAIDDGAWTHLGDVPAGTSSYVDGSATPGTTHRYRLHALAGSWVGRDAIETAPVPVADCAAIG
jgi:signal peptidase I